MVWLTSHAQTRMQTRNVSEEAIGKVLKYGRTFYTRNAVIKVIGRKEINKHKGEVDLEGLDGLHVINSHSGDVITVYRNRNFTKSNFRKARRFKRARRNRRPKFSGYFFPER